MYDNIIKIYELEGIRDNIETIESTVINNEITLHIKLKKLILIVLIVSLVILR